EFVADGRSVQSRGGHRQRRMFARNIEKEAASPQMVFVHARAVSVSAAGIGPYRADFGLIVVIARARYFGGLPALFLDVGLDDLRRGPGGEITVLPFFEQRAHDNFRISSRLHAHKPAIILEFLATRAQLRLQRITDGLRAARFARKV